MKPKKPRKTKLSLNRQTIRQLTPAQLGKADGANLSMPASPWCLPPDTGFGDNDTSW